MVTEWTRNDVWQNMLDAERLVRYYEVILDRCQRNYMLPRFILLLGMTGVLISLLELVPEGYKDAIQAVSSVMVIAALAWDSHANYAGKALVLQQVSVECIKLQVEWRVLWNAIETHTIEDEKAREKNACLSRRIAAVTVRPGDAGVREDRKLNRKCARDAYKVMAGRYAV